MNTQLSSKQNFTGGFRFRDIPEGPRTKIQTLIKSRGKQIFNDFEKPNDVFLVVRDDYDRAVLKFIKENNLKLEYYPQINTKSKLDSEAPDGLSNLLKENKFKPITSITQFKKHVNNRNRAAFIENKSSEYIDNVLSSLCIDNKHPIHTHRGAKVVVDNEFNRKIYISAPSKNNILYVKEQPDSTNQSAQRYAMDFNGNILASYKTPDGIKKFDEKFNSLLLKE